MFGKISVIVTLGGGGGGGGARGEAVTLRKIVLSASIVYNTEHLVSCSVDSSGSSYVYSDYTAH